MLKNQTLPSFRNPGKYGEADFFNRISSLTVKRFIDSEFAYF